MYFKVLPELIFSQIQVSSKSLMSFYPPKKWKPKKKKITKKEKKNQQNLFKVYPFVKRMKSNINTRHNESVFLRHLFICSNLSPYFIKHHFHFSLASLLKLSLSYFSLLILFLSLFFFSKTKSHPVAQVGSEVTSSSWPWTQSNSSSAFWALWS